jgi:hypothetical protein
VAFPSSVCPHPVPSRKESAMNDDDDTTEPEEPYDTLDVEDVDQL